MDVVVNVVLPIATLISGWALASWTNRRHRNWDALGTDLDLADKLDKHYPEHAQWVRESVAVRLKGRALSESRSRSDFLVAAAGFFITLFGGFCLLVAITSFRQAKESVDRWLTLGPFMAAVFFIALGVFMFVSGIRNRPRLPGVSELFLPQGTQIQKDLFDQLGKLHGSAIKLPDVFPESTDKKANKEKVEDGAVMRSAFVGWVVVATVVALGAVLGIVGILGASHLASPSTTWTALAALATVAAAVVAIGTLIALRQDSTDRTRPVMVAELKPAALTQNSELLVRNTGQSVARNVVVEFDPPLPDDGLLTPFLRRRYSKPIPTFAPGMVMDNYYQGHDDSEPVPDECTITFRYRDSHGRTYTDSYPLTMAAVRDQSGAYPSSRYEGAMEKRLTEAVEALARNFGRR
ncbi:hypothetical protein [Mycobacteroides chelonae]|uniref:hypothetical protein n=1 Tax=Mycobacteroides chelonae TaxID=1774 RepID=UPI0009948AA5|nr:hypothetical protein [Mycobacteroides chelonae]